MEEKVAIIGIFIQDMNAVSKANELLQKTLTDKILQEMYIDKWDGKLPQVVAGENASLMIPSINTAE